MVKVVIIDLTHKMSGLDIWFKVTSLTERGTMLQCGGYILIMVVVIA